LLSRIVSAITFDFWNTLYSADNGAMDLVRPRRVEALRGLLNSVGAEPGEKELDRAYRSGFDAYMAAWTSGAHFGAREQVHHILGVFGVTAPVESIAGTAREIEDASLLAPLQLLSGVKEAIPGLVQAGYRLGIISDTSLTPGRLLMHFLRADGLLHHFSAFTFSDATGYTKPDRRMFESTLAELGAHPVEAAHVGDTPRTDIAGAQAMGMLSIRCAAAVDHQEEPAAHFVVRDHREIPGLLDR
jgi:putative hydrolase of the HAD superfamily